MDMQSFNTGDEPSREDLFHRLKDETDVLRGEGLEAAFRDIDRAEFVAGDYLSEAYEDYPLPISSVATISQPTTVAFMLELLDVVEGESVLDVGSGSGWTTALLAHLVGNEGAVLGIEIDEDLVEFGRRNLEKFSFPHAHIEHARDVELHSESFDKILISADMREVPEKFIQALKDDGLLLAPMGESLMLFRKRGDVLEEERSIPGFVFVPYDHGSD